MLLESSRRYFTLRAPAGSVINELNLDGIKYDASGVRFETEVYTLTQAAVLSASIMCQTVSVKLEANTGRIAAGERLNVATEDNLKLVNERHTEREFKLDELFFYLRMPVNNVPSRTIGLMFTENAIAKFAGDADAGKARLRNHDRKDMVGRIFAGKVVDATVRGISGKYLQTLEYIPRSSANEQLILNIESGVYSSDSIGFTTGSKIDVKEFTDDTNKTFRVIEIDYDPEDRVPLEMRESSFVHMGELKAVGSNKKLGADDVPGSLVNIHTPVDVTRQNQKSVLWDISV